LSEAWPEVQSGTLDGTWMNNPSASSGNASEAGTDSKLQAPSVVSAAYKAFGPFAGPVPSAAPAPVVSDTSALFEAFLPQLPFHSFLPSGDTALLHPFPVPYRRSSFCYLRRYFNRFFSILLFHKNLPPVNILLNSISLYVPKVNW